MKQHKLLLVVTILLGLHCSGFAATITVNTLNFTGSGSFYEALTTANATPGPHTINFSVTGTITATTLLPIIDEEIIINAYGVTIDGVGAYQIISTSSSADVTINGLAIIRAKSVLGAAISNAGTLALNHVSLSNNSASNRGGAIYNFGGNLSIQNTTINNNQAGQGNAGGAGIYNSASGTMDISNSTITANTSLTIGGGIHNLGTMTIMHLTIANNTALKNDGKAGGGINNEGDLSIYNTIVYNNTAGFFGAVQDIYNKSTIIETENLVGVCAGSNCPTFSYSTNPLLTTLADNGGFTKTMAISSSSPAVNPSSSVGAMSNDQRGFSRDANPDLGAYEFVIVPVELLDFKATATAQKQVTLEWQTASEQNNRGFEVYRSKDAKLWEKLGFVAGAGTSLEPNSYNYVDDFPLSKLNYYRLKQIDEGGKYEFSSIVYVALNGQVQNQLKVFPNPATGIVYYQLLDDALQANEWQLKLYNMQGSVVLKQLVGSTGLQQLSIRGLPKGNYYFVLQELGGNRLLRERLTIF